MKIHTSQRNGQLTWAQAEIFDANIAKLKRTSKVGLWLIGKKDAKKVALNQFAHRHKEFQTEKGRESTKDQDPCRLSLRPEGHGFRRKTTFVSNAKAKSILGGIHIICGLRIAVKWTSIWLTFIYFRLHVLAKLFFFSPSEPVFRQNTYGGYNYNHIENLNHKQEHNSR